MVSISQQNLIKLADEEAKKGDLGMAIQNLEEALNYGQSDKIVIQLSKLYRKNGEEDQAYDLIKDLPDLFSDSQIFNEYCQVLAANHFLIEKLQLENILKRQLPIVIEPVTLNSQQTIMKQFKQKQVITQKDYQQLLKLNLVNFKSFAQSLLLDPSLNFAVRLALCEDLVRLGITESIQVWVVGEKQAFIPAKNVLLERETVYQEVISGIGDKFRNRPNQLPLMLGEANLILGSLYPKLGKYVGDTDSFVSDFISYLKNKDGRNHQKLFEQIYANLPK